MQSALSIATLTTNYKSAMKKFVKKREGWKKPPDGKLLINVDTSFREESGNGGTGVISGIQTDSSMQVHVTIWNMWWTLQQQKLWH
jgi:hypothetical protein